MRRIIFSILFCACLLLLQCSNSIGGSTETSKSAQLLNPGGSPARNAAVYYYPRNYNPKSNSLAKTLYTVDSTTTDENGNYTVELDTGIYNMVAHSDSGMVYQDSIAGNPPVCTLKTPGTLQSTVLLEGGGDARSVLILFMGTHSFTTPDDTSGIFTTEPMAAGNYHARILSSLPDYQIKDTILTIYSGIKSVMKDTIELKSTGFTAPKNLVVSYDTLHGCVTLFWNRVTSPDLAGYVVFRNDTASAIPLRLNDHPLTDTVYRDTIFSDLMNKTNLVYSYRVKTADKNTNLSEKYSMPVTIHAPSPTMVRTFINWSILNTLRDTVSINDTISAIASYTNATIKNMLVQWFIEGKDSLKRVSKDSALSGRDTIRLAWSEPGVHKIYCAITDDAKNVWQDDTGVVVISDAPVADAGKVIAVPLGETGKLHGSAKQKFGTFVKWEWKIGSGPWTTTSGPDTTFIAPITEQEFICSLAVTDDDGNRSIDNVKVIVFMKVTAISAGGAFSLFLKENGTLWACGLNTSGQLGDGTTSNRAIPVRVMTDVLTMAAGEAYSLILKNDGTLWACGDNSYGQLGTGDTKSRLSPVQIVDNVQSMAAGGDHSLIVDKNSSLWGCGASLTERSSPSDSFILSLTQIMTNVRNASAGGIPGYGYSMIVKNDNTLWTFGCNIGVGSIDKGYVYPPEQIMDDVQSVSAGDYAHSLIVQTDGALWACGNNTNGQLGDGTTTYKATPVQVMAGVRSASAGGAGYGYSFIIKTDRSLWACGQNRYGELGDTTTTERHLPVKVMTDVSSVAQGKFSGNTNAHSLILKTNGSVWGCGSNESGQLGTDITTEDLEPKQIILPFNY